MIEYKPSQIEMLNRAQALLPDVGFRNYGKKEFYTRALERAQCINAAREYAISIWNSNSLDPALQTQVILQDMLEAFEIVFVRLDIFSTLFNSVPMSGSDKIEIPYFPLQATASQSFNRANGYNTSADWTQQTREVSVGGDGNLTISGVNAAAGTARDRLYHMLTWTSYDASRQPYLNISKLAKQSANKLAVDIVTDIVKRVITVANYGAAVKTVPAAALTASDIADLREKATGAFWPLENRSLVLDHTAYTPLLKDTAFKQYLSYGSTDPLHKGRIEQAYGFQDTMEWPSLLANFSPAGENLIGFACHSSAALVVTSPIMPSDAVLNLLGRFDIIVSPTTGLALSYRRFGNAILDQSFGAIECSYGAAPGVAAGLMRITQP